MLRRAPRNEVVLVDRGAEFAILEHLNDRPIPSPRAWWQGELGGRFAMVLERCAGRAGRMFLARYEARTLLHAEAELLEPALAGLIRQGHIAGPLPARPEGPGHAALPAHVEALRAIVGRGVAQMVAIRAAVVACIGI